MSAPVRPVVGWAQAWNVLCRWFRTPRHGCAQTSGSFIRLAGR